MTHDVFISYAYNDYLDEQMQEREGNVLTRIMQALDEAGITYWLDRRELIGGVEYAREIAEHIRDSKVFVFVSSEASNASPWAAREIATATIYGKPIIPFRADNTPYSSSLILYIAALQYTSYLSNHNALQQLVSTVRTYVTKTKESIIENQNI